MKKSLLAALAAAMMISACTGYSPLGGGAAVSRVAGWSELTHGKEAAPNYEVVFPQNKVNRLDITIKAADWKLMQENMQELFGSGGGPGGFAFPGGQAGPRPSRSPAATPAPGAPPAASASPAAVPDFFAGMPPEDFTPPEGFTPPAGFPPGGPGGGPGGLEFSEEDPIYRPCTISFEGKTWHSVGIRYKGNSSLRSSWGRTLKLPFRFDFDEMEKEHPEVEDQRFYGFKRLTMSSGFTDDSLIREKVVADIFRAAGVPAARTAFYRLYVDYGEGSKYFGLYSMVEAPDKPMLSQQFGSDAGNLYKPSGNGAKFVSFDEKSFPKKTNETSSDWSDIKAVFAALHADRSDAAKWRAGLEKVFDIENYLNYLAVNTLVQNWDTYGRMAHNYYLYTDPSDGKLQWIPWDNNMALGGGMGGGGRMMFGPPGSSGATVPAMPLPAQSAASSASPSAGPSAAPVGPRPGGMGGPGRGGAFSLDLSSTEVGKDWPLIRYLIDDPVYHAKYVSYVEKAKNGAFAIAATKARYQQAHDLIKPYVVGAEGEQKDATLLSSAAAFESSLTGLYTHLEGRHTAAAEFLAKQAQ